jgi:translation initiation factor 1
MADDRKPFHNPFAALAGLPGIPAPAPAAPAAKTRGDAPQPDVRGPSRAVVRLERAGRHGKEVTVVEHLDLAAAELDRWLKALKAGLGCGGVIEGTALVLQGDHRERLPKLLIARGVKKVTKGS